MTEIKEGTVPNEGPFGQTLSGKSPGVSGIGMIKIEAPLASFGVKHQGVPLSFGILRTGLDETHEAKKTGHLGSLGLMVCLASRAFLPIKSMP